MEFILKFKGQTVLVVVACPSTGHGKTNIIIRCHDSVNGDIIITGKLTQFPDAILHLLTSKAPPAYDKFADLKSQFRKFSQFLGL